MAEAPCAKGNPKAKFPVTLQTGTPPTRLQMKMIRMQTIVVGAQRGGEPFTGAFANGSQKHALFSSSVPIID